MTERDAITWTTCAVDAFYRVPRLLDAVFSCLMHPSWMRGWTSSADAV